MVTSLIVLCSILVLAVSYLLYKIRELNKIFILIDKEQHTQNMDIIRAMKEIAKTQNFLVEQIKVNEEIAKTLQYFADKDLIRDIQNMDPNRVGKA